MGDQGAAVSRAHATSLGALLGADCPHPVRGLVVTGLGMDSRSIDPGDLFVALPGLSTSGVDFIRDAAKAGAVAALVNRGAVAATPLAIPVIEVKDLQDRVGELADRFFGKPSKHLEVYAVTGTNGKTSSVQFLAGLLEAMDTPVGTIGTLGVGMSQQLRPGSMTTPNVIDVHRALAELRDQGARVVALEASSHALEQDRLAGVQVRVAWFTNLSRDHLDYHRTMAAYAQSKRRLLVRPELELVAVNVDDPQGAQWVKEGHIAAPLVTYSAAGAAADFRLQATLLTAEGIESEVVSRWGEGMLRTPVCGRAALNNLVGVLAVLAARGHRLSQLLAAAEHLSSPPGRCQPLRVPGKVLVLVDYAHTPDGLEMVLSDLRQWVTGPIWCVFGCGGDRDRGKRPLMGEVACRHADQVVLTDDNPRSEPGDAIIEDIVSGVPRRCRSRLSIERDRAAAIRLAIAQADPSGAVLVAGKGHESSQEIGDLQLPFNDVEVAQRCLLGEAVA